MSIVGAFQLRKFLSEKIGRDLELSELKGISSRIFNEMRRMSIDEQITAEKQGYFYPSHGNPTEEEIELLGVRVVDSATEEQASAGAPPPRP